MTAPTLLLIGQSDRTASLRQAIARGRLPLAGQINHPSSLRLVPQVQSDLILLDSAASGINPMQTLPWLAGMARHPRLVVLGQSGSAAERRLLLELGADEVIGPDEALEGVIARWVGPRLPAWHAPARAATASA